jgi:alkyl sulfatase BDS1-like metallo-beta-lactamase superfamily hydrolase
LFKYLISSFLVIFIFACSESGPSDFDIPITSDVEDLIEHSKEFEQQVLTFDTPGGKIHFAIGFGIANSIMVEGDNGNIIIDAADSVYEAEKIYTLFRKINSNPIKAIIYTHNHGDHTFGASYYLNIQSEAPQIIAHEDTDFYVQRIMGILNPIITARSTKMFGTSLPDEDLINVGIGPSLSVSKSPTGYVKPTVTFKDNLKLNIAGIEIELFHAPGETNDQIFVWLPEHKSLMPGDNIYKTFPNLYTIRGTTHRDVKGWINSIDHMKSFNPSFLFPSHTKPITGVEKIQDVLNTYRDAIQFIHDQTIRLMNQGFYPDEIAEKIELPKHIASSPYLYEFYGTVRWSVKSIFNGYLGWFSGNPSELDPLSRKEKALRMSKLAGGENALLEELKTAVKDNDMQWALELSDHLITLDYFIDEVKNLRFEALIYEGSRSSNPNKRNYFLTSAFELNKKIVDSSLLDRTSEELLYQISMETMFDVLSTRYNPSKHNIDNYIVCFNFTSGNIKNITLRNQVAVVSSNSKDICNLKVTTDEIEFKKVLIGMINPVKAIAAGNISVEGGSTEFLQFLSKFR